jgi:hypothetical protein
LSGSIGEFTARERMLIAIQNGRRQYRLAIENV